MERLPFRMNWGLPLLGYGVFGALSALLSWEPAQHPERDPTGQNVYAVLLFGGVLMLFPTMFLFVQLGNRGKAVTFDDAGLEVPHRLRRSVVHRIAWSAIRAVTDHTVHVGGIKAARSLRIRHAGGVAEVTERDLGAEAFARLREIVASRANAPREGAALRVSVPNRA